MNIYLLRHGQTISPNQNVIYGRHEIDLSEDGRRSMLALSQHLPKNITHIFSSPLKRAYESAQLIAQDHIPIETVFDLQEIDFGKYSGKDIGQCGKIFKNKYASYLSTESKFDKGESVDDVIDRIKKFHTHLMTQGDVSVCIVAHQWVLNIYLSFLLETKTRTFVFEHGAFTHVHIQSGRPSLISHNSKKINKLNPNTIKEEFNKRALERNGIDKVLTLRYSKETNTLFDAYTKKLLNHSCGATRSILEVGCGIGRLAEIFKDSGLYVGVDFSEEMIKQARATYQTISCAQFVQGDACDIDFEEKKFDLGILSLVLKHNNDARTEKIIENMKKWCKKITLIEHIEGGSLGSDSAVIRSKNWYLSRFFPLKPSFLEEFKRDNDCMMFAVFE